MKMAAANSTFYQLLDIYQKSRTMGLVASLTMETRNGQDFIHFSIGDQAGVPARKNPIVMRKKTPSQLRRDKQRKEDYLKKKTEAGQEASECKVIVKPETDTPPVIATIAEPVDEINLEHPEEGDRKVFQVKGEFKDPKRKPWLEPVGKDVENEHKAFWKLIDEDKDKIGIEDFSDGSTYIEHYLEFWGDMIVNSGVNEEHLRNLENWPKGVQNLVIK